MGIDKINKRLHDAYGGQVRAEDKGDYIVAVSYTHLTLPTICSV